MHVHFGVFCVFVRHSSSISVHTKSSGLLKWHGIADGNHRSFTPHCYFHAPFGFGFVSIPSSKWQCMYTSILENL